TFSFTATGTVSGAQVGPNAQVLDGTTVVVSGGSDSFGTTPAGQALTRTFTVKNTGGQPLTLRAVTLPSGFSLATAFGSTTVAAGASTTFSVRLDASAAGNYTGPVSFSTNDPNAATYSFSISGTVSSTVPAAPLAHVLDGSTPL